MRHIHPISGKDSLASALIMRNLEPELPMEYVWHDTGWELPEVHEWINKVEQWMGIKIIRCGDNLTDIVAEEGLLPSPLRRFCTRLAKIKPMQDFVGRKPYTLYLGLRADEDDRIIGLTTSKWESHRFPLKEQGLVFTDVWKMVSESGMLPPQFFWQWMFDRVQELGGKRPSGMPDWEWFPLFSGRSRPNCDRCFYQRMYEIAWLYETHPKLFRDAVTTEESTQAKSSFRWFKKRLNGESVPMPLVEIASRASDIKERRARKIVKFLLDKNTPTLFQIIEDNPFGNVSCGLFCGK